jgi:peptidoglycan/xylan/chitin deacetylase (PgdA/CDA1 family)
MINVPRHGPNEDGPQVCEGSASLEISTWKRDVYRFAHYSGFTKIIRGHRGGLGSLLMFHEVQDEDPVGLTGGTSPRFFDDLLMWLRRQGWTFVSLTDVLRWERESPERFVCLTFDDGYRDILTNTLPILERYGAPFTLYIPTAAITRELYAWWLGLRELLLKNDVVDIDAMGERFTCPDLAQKLNAYWAITSWVRQDYNRRFALDPTFTTAGISIRDLNERYYLNERELEALSRHPLATIGGHTSSHAALSALEADQARSEITENRRFLENLLQKPVVDFAYPYGDEKSCGPREGMLVAEEGFRSAVTARGGQIWPQHKNWPHALPRIGINMNVSRAVIDGRLSGIRDLLRPGRRVVTW